MTKKRLIKKITCYTCAFLTITGFCTVYESININLLIGLLLVFIALSFKHYKEFKNPSFYEDERNMSIAYRSESISFRVTAFSLIIIFIIGNGPYFNMYPFKELSSIILCIMLMSKVISYKILQRTS